MKKEELIEALKMLARGRLDAAETIAELLMPKSKTISVSVPSEDLTHKVMFANGLKVPAAKKAK